jgi:hypothetical protein
MKPQWRHSQPIHNYAMTRTNVYVLDDAAAGRTLEIPLNTIDLQATKETNRQAGVDFSIPVSVKGPAKNKAYYKPGWPA